MTSFVLPESAPFTAEQRAWLNGFFAGLLQTHDSQPPTLASSGLPETVDVELVKDVPADDCPWHDPGLPLSERMDSGSPRSANSRSKAVKAKSSRVDSRASHMSRKREA